jgi:aromatic ring-cleaving dioxygenase
MKISPNQFVGKCINEMIKHGISIHLTQRKNNSKHASNYFDPDKKEFVVNFFGDYSRKYFLETFLHEYCHFKQMIDLKFDEKKYDKAYEIFNDWLDFNRDSCPIRVVRLIQRLELDCEKRAVHLIKKYKLPLNITDYKKQANVYILSYNLFHKHRKFFNFTCYYDKEILSLMSDELVLVKDLGVIPDKFEEIFLKNSE